MPHMMSTEQIIKILQEHRAYLAEKYGVERLGLFGSYARDSAGEESDVDIVVEFSRPIGLQFVELAEFLECVLGKRVDILTPAGIRGIRNEQIAQSIRESAVYV